MAFDCFSTFYVASNLLPGPMTVRVDQLLILCTPLPDKLSPEDTHSFYKVL